MSFELYEQVHSFCFIVDIYLLYIYILLMELKEIHLENSTDIRLQNMYSPAVDYTLAAFHVVVRAISGPKCICRIKFSFSVIEVNLYSKFWPDHLLSENNYCHRFLKLSSGYNRVIFIWIWSLIIAPAWMKHCIRTLLLLYICLNFLVYIYFVYFCIRCKYYS